MIFPLSCSQQSWTLADNPDKGQKKSTSEMAQLWIKLTVGAMELARRRGKMCFLESI